MNRFVNLKRMLLLAPIALLLASAPARAAHLDEALLKAAPTILTYLKTERYANVGILPFKVQKGTRTASYLGAPPTLNIPGRLENALIMCQGSNEARAVGIIRDAAGTASKAKIGSYTRNPIAFRGLFSTQYNLAWGNKKVKADAFVTGIVKNTGDRSSTTIVVQVFTSKSRVGGSLKLIEIGEPIVLKTDRSLLRDLGYTYALSRSMLKRGVTASRRDQEAVDQVNKQEQGQKKPQTSGQSGAITPDNIAGMAFELRYNGGKQALRPLAGSQQGAKLPQFEADPMMPGTTISMVLTRLLGDDKALGVVLKVNGRSTWKEEADESIKCRKWLYDLSKKDKPDEFLGFYEDAEGKNLRKFQVLTEEDAGARASELGDRAGWIDIDVYASSDAGPGPGQKSDEEEMMVSTRGLSRSRTAPRTLKDLQARLRKANNVKVKVSKVTPRGPGGLLLPEMEPSDEVKIDKGELPGPVHLGGISIKYYDRASAKTVQPDE
jgi:hypothetical protein